MSWKPGQSFRPARCLLPRWLRRAPGWRRGRRRIGGGREGPPVAGPVAAQDPQHAVRAKQPFWAVLEPDDPDQRCGQRVVVGGGGVQPGM